MLSSVGDLREEGPTDYTSFHKNPPHQTDDVQMVINYTREACRVIMPAIFEITVQNIKNRINLCM